MTTLSHARRFMFVALSLILFVQMSCQDLATGRSLAPATASLSTPPFSLNARSKMNAALHALRSSLTEVHGFFSRWQQNHPWGFALFVVAFHWGVVTALSYLIPTEYAMAIAVTAQGASRKTSSSPQSAPWTERDDLMLERSSKIARQQLLYQYGEMEDDDPVMVEVNKIFRRYFPKTKYPQFKIFVLPRLADKNAYALPNGNIFISAGMLRAIKTEEALAALLAHEMTHALRQHSKKRFIFRRDSGRIMPGRMADYSINSTIKEQGLKRAREYEADILGLDLMEQQGVNLYGMVELLTLLDEEGSQKANVDIAHGRILDRIFNVDVYNRYRHSNISRETTPVSNEYIAAVTSGLPPHPVFGTYPCSPLNEINMSTVEKAQYIVRGRGDKKFPLKWIPLLASEVWEKLKSEHKDERRDASVLFDAISTRVEKALSEVPSENKPAARAFFYTYVCNINYFSDAVDSRVRNSPDWLKLREESSVALTLPENLKESLVFLNTYLPKEDDKQHVIHKFFTSFPPSGELKVLENFMHPAKGYLKGDTHQEKIDWEEIKGLVAPIHASLDKTYAVSEHEYTEEAIKISMDQWLTPDAGVSSSLQNRDHRSTIAAMRKIKAQVTGPKGGGRPKHGSVLNLVEN